jgi:hypothetical protein
MTIDSDLVMGISKATMKVTTTVITTETMKEKDLGSKIAKVIAMD